MVNEVTQNPAHVADDIQRFLTNLPSELPDDPKERALVVQAQLGKERIDRTELIATIEREQALLESKKQKEELSEKTRPQRKKAAEDEVEEIKRTSERKREKFLQDLKQSITDPAAKGVIEDVQYVADKYMDQLDKRPILTSIVTASVAGVSLYGLYKTFKKNVAAGLGILAGIPIIGGGFLYLKNKMQLKEEDKKSDDDTSTESKDNRKKTNDEVEGEEDDTSEEEEEEREDEEKKEEKKEPKEDQQENDEEVVEGEEKGDDEKIEDKEADEKEEGEDEGEKKEEEKREEEEEEGEEEQTSNLPDKNIDFLSGTHEIMGNRMTITSDGEVTVNVPGGAVKKWQFRGKGIRSFASFKVSKAYWDASTQQFSFKVTGSVPFYSKSSSQSLNKTQFMELIRYLTTSNEAYQSEMMKKEKVEFAPM